MESPFEYTHPVKELNFIGRSKEVNTLASLLKAKKNILCYGAPKIGKRSIINNTITKLVNEQYNFTLIELDLFNIRCVEAFLLRFANLIFRQLAKNNLDWGKLKENFIPSAPYEIESTDNGTIRFTYKTKELLNSIQIEELLNLPQKFAVESGRHVIIYIRNFQDMLLLEEAPHFFKVTENSWSKQSNVNYIITGEYTNAMKNIFHVYKHYYGFAEEFEVPFIDDNLFADYISKCFLKSGKVIQPDLASNMYRKVGRNPWYAQHLSSLCYDMTLGYVNENIINEGIKSLINIHEFRYHYLISGLSRHQLRFTQAIMDGVTKFSSADILEKYKLNSSANVNRVRDALVKKEIITFNSNKEGVFIDPLLEYWLRNYFFTKQSILNI